MAHGEGTDPSLATRAHELYWNSDQSVNSIADDLGLSKGRLYEFVHPLPAGVLCAECGTELVYDTRTARERDLPTCRFCRGAEGQARPAAELASAGRSGAPGGLHAAGDPSRPSVPDSGDPARVLGGLLIGVAAALLLVRYFRR